MVTFKHFWFILCIVFLCQLSCIICYCCLTFIHFVRLLSSSDSFVHCSLYMRKYSVLILDCIPGILMALSCSLKRKKSRSLLKHLIWSYSTQLFATFPTIFSVEDCFRAPSEHQGQQILWESCKERRYVVFIAWHPKISPWESLTTG